MTSSKSRTTGLQQAMRLVEAVGVDLDRGRGAISEEAAGRLVHRLQVCTGEPAPVKTQAPSPPTKV